jgi:hypothetical protein
VNGPFPSPLAAPQQVATAFASICSEPDALATLEQLARTNSLDKLPFMESRDWQRFSADVHAAYADRDQVLIKGLPVSPDGATLLLTAQTVGSVFRTYRGGQIIKHFRMSPWTTELSHTMHEGEFHTDLNTEPCPPAITAMQCLDPDPGAPKYGITRVARLRDLLTFLEKSENNPALDFLTKESVTMLNDHSSSSWSGRVVDGKMIRYHPATLRAAARRRGDADGGLEDRITEVAKAAFAVSEPLIMERGDILLLSNHRTLHYRSECSAVFTNFPTEFVSRSVFILHATEESRAG